LLMYFTLEALNPSCIVFKFDKRFGSDQIILL
jgi:hypothetical protein